MPPKGRAPPRVARPGIVYGEPWFTDWFVRDATSGNLRLPHVECRRAPGAPLPSEALHHVRAGMCCVFEHARLWPAAEDKWGRAPYLRREMRTRAFTSALRTPSSSRVTCGVRERA